jgi:hypothetical protein
LIVLTAVLQPERAAAIRPQSVCVNYLLNVGCLVGLSCDVTGVDGLSPPAAAAGAKNGGVGHRPAKCQNEKTRVVVAA